MTTPQPIDVYLSLLTPLPSRPRLADPTSRAGAQAQFQTAQAAAQSGALLFPVPTAPTPPLTQATLQRNQQLAAHAAFTPQTPGARLTPTPPAADPATPPLLPLNPDDQTLTPLPAPSNPRYGLAAI